MKTTFPLFLLLLCRITFSQISGVVINSETKQPIPYVNICLLGKDIGTSANENGSFFSALAEESTNQKKTLALVNFNQYTIEWRINYSF